MKEVIMKRITVVTPTYNRANKLETAFKSLKNQTIQDFNWLIIDDGSTDNTKDIVTNVFLNDNTDFDIKYIKKENGGKHTALNLAFEIIDTELFIILDSDDYLIENAIEDIINTWEKYKNNDRIAGLVYKRGKDKETSITEKWGDEEETIKNYNDFIINRNIRGDKAEVFRSSIFKNIRFPEYNNEKFVGEGVIWSKIAHEYDMVFCNRILYICKYLEGGLSKSGRELRVNNPKGGMFRDGTVSGSRKNYQRTRRHGRGPAVGEDQDDSPVLFPGAVAHHGEAHPGVRREDDRQVGPPVTGHDNVNRGRDQVADDRGLPLQQTRPGHPAHIPSQREHAGVTRQPQACKERGGCTSSF